MSSSQVTMYVTGWCPYCARARQLLIDKGVTLEEIDVDSVEGARAQMQARSGRSTVPQIFIGTEHIGGCDDLMALDAAGGLDSKLKATGAS